MEAFLIQLVVLAATTALSAILAPKPDEPKPAAIGDFDIPVADPNKPIMVIFGTVTIDDVNCVWYGDLYPEPIFASGGKK